MLAITDSSENIHLEKQAITITPPLIISNETIARLPDGNTMESSHIATIQISGIIKQEMQIHILPNTKIAPLISLGLLCDGGCNITLDKKDMSVQKNGQEIIKGTRNKITGMW